MMKIFIMLFMLNFSVLFINKYVITYMYNFLMFSSVLMLVNYKFFSDWSSIYWVFSLDNLSFMLILLTLWIMSLMYLVSQGVGNIKMFSYLLLFLLMDLFLSFYTMNYFLFYLFFEVSLIPTFMLLMGWGYQPERLNASMYMLMYTMFASLPMLLVIFMIYKIFNSLSYIILLVNFIEIQYSLIIYFYMIFAFLVKLPIFMFHMWLPKAHVEAPISGSMILAGVMLKLGGYGLTRSLYMMLNFSLKYNYLFVILSLLGMFLLSGVCLRQMDMKLLVAYSSVVHMSLMVSSLMSMSYWGYLGSMLIMIGHGFCSPAMFVLVNNFYDRSMSRSILFNKGLSYLFPSMMLWWFLICISNMAAPVSLNLLSELMIFNVMLNWSFKLLILLILGMFLSASYSLYLFSYVFHGFYNKFLLKIFPMKVNEFMVVFMHWVPLNLLILNVKLFF